MAAPQSPIHLLLVSAVLLSFALSQLGISELRSRPVPLPGGAATYLRAVFSLPPRVAIPAAIVAALLFLLPAVSVWRQRQSLRDWFALKRSARAWKIGFVGVTALLLIATTSVGAVGRNYIQHDNGFCISCHVMSSAWQRFGTSEHRSLQCHDCHQQSMYANTRQMVIWFTLRPADIGSHKPLSNDRCNACYVTGEPETWRSVAASAGHRRHLESRDTLLKDVKCITCHGAKIHEFSASEKTCLSAGCHEGTKVKLGKMQALPVHCAACHDFNRVVAVNAAVGSDSVTRGLWPRKEQCLSCHAMREKVAATITDDPHRAVCGSCHDPHKQETSKGAAKTCASGGCHQRADTLTAMHVGLAAAKLDDCTSCHRAHTFKVDGKRCDSCHEVPSGARRVFRNVAVGAAAKSATFSHEPHARVECQKCHATDGSHGRMTLRSAKECESCHHASASPQACASCHRDRNFDSRTITVTQTLKIAAVAPQARTLKFEHRVHNRVSCTSCHTYAGGRVVVSGAGVRCAKCHDKHHAAESQCRACHKPPAKGAHTVSVHRDGCAGSGCHDPSLRLPKAPLPKTLCNACHEPGFKHKSGRRCLDCHDVKDPTAASPGEPRRNPPAIRP